KAEPLHVRVDPGDLRPDDLPGTPRCHPPGWPPVWRLSEMAEEHRQLLATGRAASSPPAAAPPRLRARHPHAPPPGLGHLSAAPVARTRLSRAASSSVCCTTGRCGIARAWHRRRIALP